MHHLRFVLALLVTSLTTITAAPLSAQEAILRGTVTDSATGGPVAGATVTVVGTDRRTETNADGQYRLADLARALLGIRVQMIGYAPAGAAGGRSAKAKRRSTSCWRPASPSSRKSCRWATARSCRAELSTAVSSVDAKDLTNQPIASVDAALQGKAPGVQVVQNAGNPGNAHRVRVRGVGVGLGQQRSAVRGGRRADDRRGHLPAGAGRPGHRGDQRPQPRRVETVDVLKDAAAAAIYGSRGSNGVVHDHDQARRRRQDRRSTFNSYIGTQSASKRLPLLNCQAVPRVLQRERRQRRLRRRTTTASPASPSDQHRLAGRACSGRRRWATPSWRSAAATSGPLPGLAETGSTRTASS